LRKNFGKIIINKKRLKMHKIISVKPLSGYKLWIKFSDGVEGVVNLSDLKDKGVFKTWDDKKIFDAVYIDSESHTLAWPGGIDLCPDTLYAELTGQDIKSLFNFQSATAK